MKGVLKDHAASTSILALVREHGNRNMNRPIVVVAGNLGVGKTTLVEMLGQRLQWHIVHEAVSDNPYLRDYYANMAAWAFHLQLYFLGHRAAQHLGVSTVERGVIMDRSVYEDANVFAKALYEMGKISERDHDTYMRLYGIVERVLPKPSLLVYLTAPVNVLMERISARGLAFDRQGIDENYIASIASYYRRWIDEYRDCPVYTIDTAQCNYVADVESFNAIVAGINQYIGG